MPPVTPELLAADPTVILRQKSVGQPITAGYQGKVGAIYKNGDYFILSPNMNYIPEPANNEKTTFKYDGKLGDDDPLQWPQPFIDDVSHFAVIPLPKHDLDPATDPLGIIHNPFKDEWIDPINGATLLGLYHLQNSIVKFLKKNFAYLKDEYKVVEDNPKYSKTGLGARLLTVAAQFIDNLENLPMSRKQMRFVFFQYQRIMKEMLALTRYLKIFQPRMNSADVKTEYTDNPADAVGAFVVNPSMANTLWKGGVPVWLILPAASAGSYRVDELVDLNRACDHVVVEDDPLDHRGVFYSGSAYSLAKYDFISAYTRHYLVGSNPFARTSTSLSFGSVLPAPALPASSVALSSSYSAPSTSAPGPIRTADTKAARR